MVLGLRASDRDRRRAVAALQAGYVEGRLSTATFEARLELVEVARTTDALRALIRDLRSRWLALDAVMQAATRRRSAPVAHAPVWATLVLSRISVPRLLIGRDAICQLVLDDPTVSRIHARLERTPDGWHVRDLDSTNGVCADGHPVGHAPVAAGTRLHLGAAVLDLV